MGASLSSTSPQSNESDVAPPLSPFLQYWRSLDTENQQIHAAYLQYPVMYVSIHGSHYTLSSPWGSISSHKPQATSHKPQCHEPQAVSEADSRAIGLEPDPNRAVLPAPQSWNQRTCCPACQGAASGCFSDMSLNKEIDLNHSI